MDNNEGEVKQEVADMKEEVKELEKATDEVKDTTDWKAKYEETEGRLKRAETKLEKLKISQKAEEIVEKRSQTGELDDVTLDFFDLKGYGDEEETKIFHNIMKKTGMSHREVIKDEYALAKINALREAKKVKDATPSATRRTGNTSDDVDYWVSKVNAGGELPKDFELKTKVLAKITAANDTSIPPWRRK